MVAESSRSTTGQRNHQTEVAGASRRTVAARAALIALLLVGCAEVGAPPGGEPDRTGPRLLESSPVNGALNVPPGHEITLVFSERVVKPDRGEALYISPRPRIPAKVQWKSDRVLIRLFDPFETDQTYVVSVGTEVKDLRGNPLDTAITLAFSTGATLDSGTVAGEVFRDRRAAAGAVMALYKIADERDSLAYDSLFADYLTTTNKEGMFAFKYLPDHTYRLVGFEDKNRDQFFNPQTEAFALPDRSVVVGGPVRLDSLRLTMTTRDTLPPTVVSIVSTPDNLVKARLSKSIATAGINAAEALTLTSLSDTTVVFPASGFLERDTSDTQVLTAYFPNLADGLYRWTLIYDAAKPPVIRDSLKFERREDETPPAVARFQPGSRNYYADRIDIRLTASEPLDLTRFSPETFFLRESDSVAVPVTPEPVGPFGVRLIPERLLPGKRYRLDIAEFDLVDLAGNKMGDSVLSYGFGTLDRDSLGSVSGDLTLALVDRAAAPVVMTFAKAGKADEKYELTVRPPLVAPGAPEPPPGTGRPFSLELPAGKYLLSAFVDENHDSLWTPGILYPYHHAETQVAKPDTVAVRARFETAGVEFRID